MENRPQPSPANAIQAPATGDAIEHEALTLGKLSQAFASMLGQENDVAPSTSEPEEPASKSDDACEINPRSILEAMLFVGRPDNQPITAQQLAGLMRGVDSAEVERLIGELNSQYAAEARPYEVASDETGYRMVLRAQYSPVRERYLGRLRRARLSQAAVEVLALVAYNEPVTAEQVARMRGGSCGQILHHLVRRQLLQIERADTGAKPRKKKYLTTQRFLDVFRLKGLEELPRSEELEA